MPPTVSQAGCDVTLSRRQLEVPDSLVYHGGGKRFGARAFMASPHAAARW